MAEVISEGIPTDAVVNGGTAFPMDFNPGMFAGPQIPDSSSLPMEDGAAGVVNPSITGSAQVGGSQGPTPAR